MLRSFICALLLLSSVAQAGFIRTHHELVPDIGANATRNTPDPASAIESFRIESGQTVRITGNESVKDIYVNGMGDADAVLEMTPGCELRVQTIVLAGPRAYWRTPPGQPNSHKVVWRNLPFDITTDPQQFGNGCIVISGKCLLTGDRPRQCKVDVAAEIIAGQATIMLRDPPTNWLPGDKVWIPDTRQPATGEQTEVRTIESVTGNTVRLTEAVMYPHLGCRYQDGSARELFPVANATQPIVWQSESATGRRAHAIALDHARIECIGVTAVDMGRTTVAPIHNTLWTVPGDASTVTQYGTNQIGRYSFWHWHGCPGDGVGEWNQIMRHCSIVGSPKLGVVLHHSSHFAIFEDIAILDCAGGYWITETPNVYGCCLRNCIIMGRGTPGSGQRITDRANRNQSGGDHWHGGVGLGLQSAMNEFHDVDIFAVKEGIGISGFGTTQLFRPIMRGVHTDTPATREPLRTVPARYPFLPSSDVRVWGAYGRGIETWTADCYPDTEKMFPGLSLIHCPRPTDFQDQRETTLFGYRSLGDWTKVVAPTSATPPSSYGLNWKPGYRFGITVNGGEISGHGAAYEYVHDDDTTSFNGVHIDCPTVAYHSQGRYDRSEGPQLTSWTDCTWGPSTSVLMDGWYPKYDLALWMRPNNTTRESLDPIVYEVKPWKDRHDYRVYHYEQLASFALAPIPADQAYGDWPAGVSTNAELINRGTPIFGEVIPPTAFQRADFGPFWVDDVTPAPPTLEERVEDLERRVEQLEMD